MHMINEFAKAMADMAKIMLEQSTPEQRGSWITDIVTNGFKGTSLEGEENIFLSSLNRDTQLSIFQTAQKSPDDFQSIIIIANSVIESAKNKDNAIKVLDRHGLKL